MNSRAIFLFAVMITVSVFAVIRLADAVDAARTADADSPSAVTIQAAAEFGSKIAIREGRESVSAPIVGENARRMAAADFDSDGVADLAVADDAGTIRFLKGNSAFLTNPQIEPFLESQLAGDAGIAPDFLEHGDFNADGKQDLIAARAGGNELVFVAGAGDGRFAEPVPVAVEGELTTLAVGEYGLADGQTDIAVGVTAKKGSRLLIFEHPAGAVNHKPEIIALPESARFAAMGFLGSDGYSDIAIGCDSRVVFVQGRGQVAPWDSLRPKEFRRPEAPVSTRLISGGVAGIAIGQFESGQAHSVAVLTKDGAIRTFKPGSDRKTTNFENSAQTAGSRKSVRFLPSSVDTAPFAASDIGELREEIRRSMPESGSTGRPTAIESPADREQRTRREAEEMAKLSPAERDAMIDRIKLTKNLNDRKSRENFLKTVAAVPEKFAGWQENLIIRDPGLGAGRGLTKARVGFSGKDDLIVVDSVAKRISIVAEATDESGAAASRIFAFDSDAEPVNVIPAGLNLDAKSDLVVLRKGSGRPTFMMSVPSLTLTVNSDLDNTGSCPDQQGNCTLRSAILTANSNPGSVIVFNLGTASTISPFTELPIIRGNGTVISGLQSNAPSIEIDGTNAGIADGLKIRTSDAVVTGLAINSFNGFDNGNGSMVGGNGITIESTALSPNNGNNWVFGNYLGTDLSGTLDKGNFVGLNLFDTHDNLIGHSNQAFRQVISGNGDRKANEEGLGIIATNSVRGKFYGNIVGLDPEGEIPVPNNMGVLLTGSNNDFGGAGVGEGNTVSGNEAPNLSGFGLCTGEGIMVVTLFAVDANDNPTDRLTFANRIIGSRIGTDRNGMADLGNCREGILTSPDTATSIGSITEQGRNTVSGNGFGGISCIDISAYVPQLTTDFGFCAISGNNVGVDITGTVGIPNDFYGAIGGFSIVTENGINVYHNLNFGVVGLPFGFTMGGSCTGLCNLVNGVIYRNGGYGDVGVFSNYTGVNKTGVISINNYPTNFSPIGGIFASRGNTTVGDFSSIDGVPTSFGNLISGSRCGGLLFGSDIRDNAFGLLSAKANLIGTDAAGLGAVPNGTAGPESCGEGGVRLQNLYGNIEFGGTTPETKNIVSGNIGNGINVGNEGGRLDIINTYIGVNTNGQALGNTEDGIDLFGAGETVIGGTDPNTGNIIRHNGKAGIAALAFQGDTVHHLMIVGNSIHANGELGIDLMRVNGTFPFPNDGVNQNDCLDADDGANSLQNFPELLEPVQNSDGTVTINGVLTSTPLSAFRIDFYASSSQDSTEHGEGEIYIGSVGANTDGNGFESFSFTSATQVNAGLVITATATNEFGETSEFSCIAGGCGIGAKTIEELAPNLSCAEPIIVNIATDEPDADTNDSVCDVDVTANNGLQCSLRAALQQAANLGSANVIGFDIPGGGVHVISPLTPLPPVVKVALIDGSSQPGYLDSPLIELNGEIIGDSSTGLNIQQSGTVIEGLAINRFRGTAIAAAVRTTVRKCYIGLGADGLTRPGESLFNHVIGVAAGGDGLVAEYNVLAFNRAGIQGNLKNARIVGNKIGVDRNGQPFNGIDVTQDRGIDATGGTGLLIGSKSDVPDDRNIVGGADIDAISFFNVSDSTIRGNYIGLDSSGETAVSNRYSGIKLSGTSARNLIRNNVVASSGFGDPTNVSGGININRGDFNTVVGNRVGISISGQPRPNYQGIVVNSNKNRIGIIGQPNIVCSSEIGGILIINPSSTFVTDNRIEGNLVGVNNGAACSNHAGIRLGGNVERTVIHRNVVSGNEQAIELFSVGAANTVSDNIIGLGPDGTTAIPNESGVVLLSASFTRVIGNTISGNLSYGVLVGEVDPDPLPTRENVVASNKIGTDVSGSISIPNGAGIFLTTDAVDNLIGGEAIADGNVISGNTNQNPDFGIGILIAKRGGQAPSGNRIYRNRIGLAADTDAVVPNNRGIFINDAPSNFIGGDGLGNFIAGNLFDGIVVRGAAATGNRISGNTVVGNGGSGVVIEGVGGGTPRNIAPEGAPLVTLTDNDIGVILNGELGSVWSNQGDGVRVIDSINIQIGEVLAGFGNNLCSALGNGISIINSAFIIVHGNRIGTDQVGTPNCGNSQNGVFITNGSNNNTVGGPEEGSGNTITGNGGDGVRIDETAGDGNLVDPNTIFGNGGLGIDLNGEGLSVNDPSDADGGANRGQNYPQISNFSIDGNGDLIVEFSVDSSPDNADYGTEGLYVEFFEADGGGEGQHFLGSARYLVSDYNGALAGLKTVNLGNAAALGFQSGDRLSATATDAGGNTSEFSPVLAPTAASVTVSGQVFNAAGNPVSNTRLTLRNITTGAVLTARSNAFGKYRFDGVEVGETYIVTVSAKGLTFKSSGSLVTVDDQVADLDFIADR